MGAGEEARLSDQQEMPPPLMPAGGGRCSDLACFSASILGRSEDISMDQHGVSGYGNVRLSRGKMHAGVGTIAVDLDSRGYLVLFKLERFVPEILVAYTS